MKSQQLRPNEGHAIPRHLVFVDCETRNVGCADPRKERHELWFGCAASIRLEDRSGALAVTRRDERVFYQSLGFWDWLSERAKIREVTWIVAHNLGFDATILDTWSLIRGGALRITLPGAGRKTSEDAARYQGLLLIEDPPTVICLEDRESRRYVLVDTLNYWRVSLKMLGHELGLEKLEMPSRTEPMEAWITYCHRDVEIIERAMVELLTWWRAGDYGRFRWTAPGLAMSAYRHRFMMHPITFHPHIQLRRFERQAYYGGQLEAYMLGDLPGPIFEYDVNSLYPSVMRGGLYPIKLIDYDLDCEFSAACPVKNPACAIAQVEVRCHGVTLPIHSPDGTMYCTGEGITHLAGPELAWAVERGMVSRWGSWAEYECAEIFTDFVDHFYLLKQDAEQQERWCERMFVKLLLNSLYGKFGQRGGEWRLNPSRVPLLDFGEFWELPPGATNPTKCLCLYDKVFDWSPDQEIQQSAPAISAFVTSAGRQRMRQLKQVAGHGHYYYQSTDSLIVDAYGRYNLEQAGEVDPYQIGKLRLQHSGLIGWIGGLHWYSIGDRIIEGGKKSGATTISEDDWQELCFEGLESIWSRGGEPVVEITRVNKHRSRIYRKGKIMENCRVAPFRFAEILDRILASPELPKSDQ
jgi:hypothetical protein